MQFKRVLLFIVLFILSGTAGYTFAQVTDSKNLSGNLYIDAKAVLPDSGEPVITQIIYREKESKSPVIAGVLSGILPGAGELYAGQYLKAGIFLTVEAAAITTALVYNHKGDYQTAFFEWYSNLHWSAARYARWTLNNIKYLNSSVDPSQYHVFNSNGTVNRSELNRLEDAIGGGYSHELAQFGTQDYYEITGKYPQFSHGWDASNQSDTDYHILTPQFLWYAHQRGLANSLYETASFAIGAIYVNHFLSILDAIWNASVYNKSFAMNVRLQDIQEQAKIYMVPTLNLSYSF